MWRKFVKTPHVKSCFALNDIQSNTNFTIITKDASLIHVLSCLLSTWINDEENEPILTKFTDNNKSIEFLEAKEKETENFVDKLIEIETKLDIFTNVRKEHTKKETIVNHPKKITEVKGNHK